MKVGKAINKRTFTCSHISEIAEKYQSEKNANSQRLTTFHWWIQLKMHLFLIIVKKTRTVARRPKIRDAHLNVFGEL